MASHPLYLIKRRQKHGEAFSVNPIRAVLIETTDETRARKLMEIAQPPRRFWKPGGAAARHLRTTASAGG